MNDASARYQTGLDYLAMIEGQRPPSLEANLKDIAPDLARLAIEFAYGEVYPRRHLDLRQRQLATAGALAALGHARPQLKFHLGGALNVGCTPEELVELAIHMTVYAGFPAAINTAMVLKELFEERGIALVCDAGMTPRNPDQTRYEQGWEGLKDIDGNAGERVISALQDISPDLGRYIIEFAFGDVYSRSSMDLPSRELVTVAALTALGTAFAQLKVHMHGFLNVGGTKDQLIEIITHTAVYAGFPAAINGALAAKEVMAEREQHHAVP
ncbi:carboxymuconolactone decarboxylase family protein [Cupriavidus basilensis]|uniref:Carboxymuconolactone decarboxylase family protein n=1 Tax=Cupriavidus basilensis TaxID=68895 RepID=A0ABT6AKW3_9BURK|nr:carboxymuconolactone decarboxylase family protein [Cupriavidus basilensis]MDF3833249.1 carboxymuconolactone decarboxylase family protein [Cupriavidus basilensis]